MQTVNKGHLNFQRKVLGVLCALLGPCCILFGLLGDNLPGWYKSISATYYANSKICMIGLLFATAVFFLTYKGYDKKDTVMAIIQGVSALGVIVFPCATEGIPERVGLFNLPVSVSNVFHCISASVLFVAFAIMISWLFTQGDDTNPQKAKRNTVYDICAIIIYTGCALMAIKSATPILDFIPDWFPVTWFMETVMLEAYAVAWLTKAETFEKLNDKE